MNQLIPKEIIEKKIFLLRGQKVMLSVHLADMYGVQVKVLMQAVKRNIERFPEDFMFQLTWEEVESLRSQIVTLNRPKEKASKRGRHIKYMPYAFTEQGIAMLSSVLKSEPAVQVNIAIIRTFVKLREMLLSHRELAVRLDELERKIARHDVEIRSVFEAIRRLMEPPQRERRQIGFKVEEKKSVYKVSRKKLK